MKRRSFLRGAAIGTVSLGTFGRSLATKNLPTTSILKMPEQEQQTGTRPVRIAIVQQDSNPGQVEENRKKALQYAAEALEQKADVILFHEELLVGYVENVRELAEPLEGPTTRAFQELLKGTDARIIYGLTEREGDDYYISAPIVSGNGVVANYHKTHLFWKGPGGLRHEPTFYKPGNKLVTFDIKGFKSGIMICYDGGFPEMTRSYANLGCSMLFWMNHRRSRGHEEVQNLALTNSIIMPTSCCCGIDERGAVCPGGSHITGAKGELISELWDKEGIVISDVYPEHVEQLREQNHRYTGLRPEIYYYG